MRKTLLISSIVFLFAACSSNSSNSSGDTNPSASTDTPFTISDASALIGGPVSQGRVGDILLSNDKIRVLIQKPRKNAGVNSFGGTIIDADIVRPSGEAGQDNFGSIFPLVNIEWTVNYQNFEVISDGTNGAPKVLRAHGKIDAYDYLDLDFIGEVAEGIAGQRITFSNHFDDRRNPFSIYEDLKGVSNDVVTDYTLEPGKNYVRIDTTFTNRGDQEAKFPVGQLMNGSGQNSMLIPGIGFTPDLMTQIGGNTPAVIFAGFDNAAVSYGYFYPAAQFENPETDEPYSTTSVSYSGVTGLLMGEEFLKLAPLGQGGTPEVHFKIQPGESRTITGYFIIGNGSASSVMDTGLAAIRASARPITGEVLMPDGSPAVGATVSALSRGNTVVTFRTDSNGRFGGMLPTGGNLESRRFGNGKYSFAADIPGYHKNGTSLAATCLPEEIDLATQDSARIECTMGEAGTLALAGPVVDGQTGKPIAARLTIVGEDPSPNKVGSAGRFHSTIEWELPFGIAGMKYITALGTFDMTGEKNFRIEPGIYKFTISHGPEYTIFDQLVEVKAGQTVTLGNITLARAVETPGYISADFHIHSIYSPDSSLPQEMRVLSASAEGLDVLQSSDHDYITDYGPVAESLMSQGIIPAGSIKTSSGEEITPNHYGHLHAFPLTANIDDPEGGPIYWSDSSREDVSFAPDYVWTLDELIGKIRTYPGEKVIQINHIMDNPTGLLCATGWVTTPFYLENFGVAPLSSYADPVERRMPPSANGGAFPIPFGSSGLVTTNFDSMELAISPHMNDNGRFFKSALPTWFNLLNLGIIVTATADSDSHKTTPEPVGLPRNYIASSVDPRDGVGTNHSEINLEEYAANIKAHKVTVSAGPIVMMRAETENGQSAAIGATLTGSHARFTVDVKAPSWGWFDTIDIYANTEPIPIDDETDTPMQGTAADPAQFYKPYHTPRYTYEPMRTFKKSDGTIENWHEENGVITASVSFEIEVNEDTWVVALARGTKSTPGYRSLFPVITKVLINEKNAPETFDTANLSSFHASEKVGAQGWGLTNPIFIDVDGGGFTAKHSDLLPTF